MPRLAPTDMAVTEFIDKVENPGRREDAYTLLELFERITGFEARMWGPSIIGFGSYHYRYASGHEGDAPLAAFAPRKANMVVYLTPGLAESATKLASLGKHRASKGCLYLGRLSSIDLDVLADLVVTSKDFALEQYPHGA